MDGFSRPNSCKLKKLSKCNEFELISLSKDLKDQYQLAELAENEPDNASMLNMYLNLYLDLTETVYDYKGKNIDQILNNIKTIYKEKLKDIEDEREKRRKLANLQEMLVKKQIGREGLSLSHRINTGEGIRTKKRKQTKGKKTKGKKTKGKN